MGPHTCVAARGAIPPALRAARISIRAPRFVAGAPALTLWLLHSAAAPIGRRHTRHTHSEQGNCQDLLWRRSATVVVGVGAKVSLEFPLFYDTTRDRVQYNYTIWSSN